MKKRIMILAGEESGAVYAERLKELLRDKAEFKGYQDFFKTEDLAVFGVWEVLRRIFFFVRVKRKMEETMRAWRPHCVVTIDYPGLNLKLAAYAKSLGIPAVHIVCPQVWAWHQGRVPSIPAKLTRLLCFFPFEPAIFKDYESASFSARFIGHPMADIFRAEEEAKGTSRPPAGGKTVAVLPGSRVGEVTRHMPRLAKAMEMVAARVPGVRFRIPAANSRARGIIEKCLAGSSLPVEILDGGARDVLRSADCAAVASGTATLEAALAGVPTVLVYAVGPLLAAFLRRAITGVRHVGLANVLAEKTGAEPPMPELLQEAFTPEAVADLLAGWLSDPAKRAAASVKLSAVLATLRSDTDALVRAAREIEEVS